MAIEGNTREYYYMAFDEIIQKPQFKFVEKNRGDHLEIISTL